MSREQFERRRAAVIAYLYPTYKPYELASEGIRPSDPLQKELAIRERPNRVGILAVSLRQRFVCPSGGNLMLRCIKHTGDCLVNAVADNPRLLFI